MKILVIGSGGREHAIAWKLSQSPRKPELFVAPGNAGISQIAKCIPVASEDLQGLLKFALENKVDLTVVGPEQPLVDGIVDLFESEGLKIIGPNKKAAQFEGSKDFTKQFLVRHNIPTAAFATYESVEEAIAKIDQFGFPLVVKADGLAAGKGVIIAQTKEEAVKALKEMMSEKVFGASGEKVVLESFLEGTEASILCFCDGDTLLPMAPAQDYKKALDGDLGLNTGGMGTYSPSRIIDKQMMAYIQEKILNPFVLGAKRDGIAFKGILFVGLMINQKEEEPIKVLEYNVRMGDPETEVTLPRLENDLIDIFEAILNRELHQVALSWSEEAALCVILASGGYPEVYEKGLVIEGIESVEDAQVFHCGTKFTDHGISTNGGRVLAVTALGSNLQSAREIAYANVSKIHFNGMHYRTDIGK